MSKDTASALKEKGQQHKTDLAPSLEAQAQALRAADQAAAAAREALARVQGESAAAEAAAAAEKARMDSLVARAGALDGAIRNADNAADIFGAIERLQAGEVAEDLIAPFLQKAADLEAAAAAVIDP